MNLTFCDEGLEKSTGKSCAAPCGRRNRFTHFSCRTLPRPALTAIPAADGIPPHHRHVHHCGKLGGRVKIYQTIIADTTTQP